MTQKKKNNTPSHNILSNDLKAFHSFVALIKYYVLCMLDAQAEAEFEAGLLFRLVFILSLLLLLSLCISFFWIFNAFSNNESANAWRYGLYTVDVCSVYVVCGLFRN